MPRCICPDCIASDELRREIRKYERQFRSEWRARKRYWFLRGCSLGLVQGHVIGGILLLLAAPFMPSRSITLWSLGWGLLFMAIGALGWWKINRFHLRITPTSRSEEDHHV